MGSASSEEVGVGLGTERVQLRGWLRATSRFDRFYISLKLLPTQGFMNLSDPCVLYKTARLICCSRSFKYESQAKPKQISLDSVEGSVVLRKNVCAPKTEAQRPVYLP